MLGIALHAIASARSKAFFFFSSSSFKPSLFLINPEQNFLACVSSSSVSPSLSSSPSTEMRMQVTISHNAEAPRLLLPFNGHHGIVSNHVNLHVSSSSSASLSCYSTLHGRSCDHRFLFSAVSSSTSFSSYSSSSFRKFSATLPQMLYKNHGRSLQRKRPFTISSSSSSSSFSSLQNLSATLAFGPQTENQGHSFCTSTGNEASLDAVETPPSVDATYHTTHAHAIRMNNEGKECKEVRIELCAEAERNGCAAVNFSEVKQDESEGEGAAAESILLEKDGKEGNVSVEPGQNVRVSHDVTSIGCGDTKRDDQQMMDNSLCSKKHAIQSDHQIATRVTSRINRTCERIRRKHGLFPRNNVPQELPDLLTVPGIGPRNLEKLVSKGIAKVAELKKLYRDKFLHDESKKMVEYLQSSVGIVHRNHAQSITSYVKLCVDEEIKEQLNSNKESAPKQRKKLTICVEGNISVGKTTFLQKISNEIIELRDMVEIVPEPVDKWKDVGPDHFNLLDAFYKEPERYAYTFQNYVFASRLMKEQETSKGMKLLRLMERSIFSDRLVFVRAVHEAKWMNELELRIYESWFDPFISALPGLVPDGFIYLRASPDTCLRRLHMRNRPEEQGVTLEYLRGLHEKHEQCFFPSASSGGILSVSGLPGGPNRILPSPRIRDRVFYLEGDHLHSSIKKVPALILDCEATVDLNRDLEARAEYAQQVAEFYEYLRSNRDSDLHQTSTLAFSQHSSAFLTKI